MRLPAVLLVLVAACSAAHGEGIPKQTLLQIKAGTVFLKVKRGTFESSGTGFVVQSQGDTVYLVTNHHVSDGKPPADEPGRSTPFGFPPPPPRFGPFRVRMAVDPNAKPEITAVFFSGTKDERTASATVVLSEEARDLALLEIRGFKDPPKAIVTDRDPELVETTPVYVFGFPFGEALSENDRNPAISVGRGTVSSLREDRNGELTTVQIDGALNPGNSGGPVVDGDGKLVGVAVATIKGAGIGLAIPQQIVRKMLHGRAGDLQIASRSVSNGEVEFEASVPLIDPFQQIKSVAVHYLVQQPTETSAVAPRPESLLPGATKVALDLKDRRGSCQFKVKSPTGAWVLLIQSATVHGDGSTVYSTPAVFGMSGAPQTVEPKSNPSPNASKTSTNPPPASASTKKQLSASGAARVIETLKSQSPDELSRILKTLAAFAPGEGAAEIVESLETLLSSKEPEVRRSVAEVLETWSRRESVPHLTKVLADEVPQVRQSAMRALARLKAENAAEGIAARLKDESDRETASQALVALGDACQKAVCKLLDPADADTCGEACRILGLIGTKSSLDDLRTIAGGKDETLAAKAKAAIEKIEGR